MSNRQRGKHQNLNSSRDRDIGSAKIEDISKLNTKSKAIDPNKNVSIVTSGRQLIDNELSGTQKLVSPIQKVLRNVDSRNGDGRTGSRSKSRGTNKDTSENRWDQPTARDIASRQALMARSTSSAVFPNTAAPDPSRRSYDDRNLLSVPPMNLDVGEVVPSWGFSTNDFGGRGATSVPKPRSTSNTTSNTNKQGFLPGLMQNNDVEDRLNRSLLGTRKPIDTSRGGPNIGPNTVGDPYSRADKNTNPNSATRRLFVSDQASYAIETNPTVSSTHPARGEGPGKTDRRGNVTDRGRSCNSTEKTDRSVEVEPWAFKIIEKYHADDCARPHSRCSTRRTAHENLAGPSLNNKSHNLSASNLTLHTRNKR